MPNNQEHLDINQEHSAETQLLAAEQLERLSKTPEMAAELSPRDIEARAEKARNEALLNATGAESKGKDAEKAGKQNTTIRRGSINKKQHEESYKKTLRQVQKELPMGSRVFSKITHLKVIERTSDIIGDTIARPDAMLSGAFFAFIATLLVYVVAKNLGYLLSGFETIAAFIIGWLAGIIYDYFRILITGKKY